MKGLSGRVRKMKFHDLHDLFTTILFLKKNVRFPDFLTKLSFLCENIFLPQKSRFLRSRAPETSKYHWFKQGLGDIYDSGHFTICCPNYKK